MRTSVAALLLLLAPMTAGAQFHDGLAPPDGNEEAGWSGRGELGLALSKGNTESESFLGKFDLAHVTSLRRHAFGASAQYASTDDIESARRYELHGTSGWRLDERSYVYATLRNERDNFGSYEYQWTAAAGYGYEAIRGEAQALSFEAGPGYRFAKDHGVRDRHREAIIRGLADWTLKLTDTASQEDTLLVESGSDNTFALNVFGVKVKVSDSLAMKAGLETRFNSRVEAGIRNTDILTTVNLVYDFK